ncbi:hypothetical protein GCM10022243_08170 [Saccharothrix violaceirubra]
MRGGLQERAAEFSDARQKSHLSSLTVDAPTGWNPTPGDRGGQVEVIVGTEPVAAGPRGGTVDGAHAADR